MPRRTLICSLGLALGFAIALVSCRPGARPVSKPEPRPPEERITPPPPPPRREAPPRRVPPPPPPPPPVPTGPLVVRVGLATDLRSVDLPCCDARLELDAGGEMLPLSQTASVSPAGTLAERAVYRLQVAALKDERQAIGLAERLAATTGQPADAVFDAGTDLYRVRVGRFATREEAEAGQGRLQSLGLEKGWIASEGGDLRDPAFEIVLGGERRDVPGRWLEISAPAGVGIPYDGVRYRGRLLIFLNERGNLNIINEIELEDYLRGVVPKEMGPELFDRLEALKAQAVAARTYTVRSLDEFKAEGYDICSTPRCQVYGGMAVEHPVSDRAVAETAGQVVLFEGQPAETFYGATCGGHTENVEVIFPLKTGPYLRGVPCLESGAGRLQGGAAVGTPFPAGLTRRLLPPAAGKRHRSLAARMEQLALLAHLPVPKDRLRSMRRKEVLRFATSVYDLALDRRLRSTRAELETMLEEPPADWRGRERELAAYLVSSSWLAGTGEEAAGDGEVEELLFRLASYLGVVERQRTSYLRLVQGRLEVKDRAGRHAYDLTSDFATFRRRGDSLSAGQLELMAGDRLDLYRHRGDLIALVQPVEASPVRLAGKVSKQTWSRFISARKLRSAVQARYPGFPFEGFEVVARGVSGRVGKLRLLGTGGESLEVEGLAVRWTLDVWDNLFWAQPSNGGGGEPGWVFRGKGWGHGVGMCQAGAFGMAVRGASYRAILGHYYTGIELGRLKPNPERPRFGETG
ncbi:MAG: SpoIID/LytB domain-containing protein [bacterium]|nr:SpoIID/LytB domain-containing protein [bacterium]